MEAFFAKALEVNEVTNAVTQFIETALDEADDMDKIPLKDRKPLHGIPFSIKEHCDVKGTEGTIGIPRKLGLVSKRDAGLAWMLRELGAIPFCKTNLPQTNLSFDCSNPIFGATKNFLDPKRSPGGSSGGEGALIAGGGSILGIGTDIGGSVRIPSAFCGLVGIKPTAGRFPLLGGTFNNGIVGVFPTVGLLTKSAQALEMVFRELLKEEIIHEMKIDHQFVPIPYSETKILTHRKWTIGWHDYDGKTVATPGMRRAVKEAVALLEKNGHTVVHHRPKQLPELFDLWEQFIDSDGGKIVLDLVDGGPSDVQSFGFKHWQYSLPLWIRRLKAPIIALWSPKIAQLITGQMNVQTAYQMRINNNRRMVLMEQMLKEWAEQEIDVMIIPGFACPALPIGYPGSLVSALSYTGTYNSLNFPVGSLPVTFESAEDQRTLETDYPGYETDLVYGWIKDGTRGGLGLPLNVQVVGRPWYEETVLRVMGEIEASLMKDSTKL